MDTYGIAALIVPYTACIYDIFGMPFPRTGRNKNGVHISIYIYNIYIYSHIFLEGGGFKHFDLQFLEGIPFE